MLAWKMNLRDSEEVEENICGTEIGLAFAP
jgi:hypothetical protein